MIRADASYIINIYVERSLALQTKSHSVGDIAMHTVSAKRKVVAAEHWMLHWTRLQKKKRVLGYLIMDVHKN